MLASMNYLLILDVDDRTDLSRQQYGNDVPRYGIVRTKNKTRRRNHLRFHDPMKFLHMRNIGRTANALFDRAREKLSLSTRFGRRIDGGCGRGGVGGGGMAEGAGEDVADAGSGSSGLVAGPFSYGWKSMPRQVYGDFSTGLSDDGSTIEHPNDVSRHDGGGVGASTHGAVDGGLENERSSPRGTVAYVLAVTSCYGIIGGDVNVDDASYTNNRRPADEKSFRDFAMMLRANVHANSHRNPSSCSAYDYEMHAIVHPRAKKCRPTTSPGHPSSVENSMDDGGGEGTTDVDVYDGYVDRSVVLQNLGYKVSVRDPPITNSSDIVGSEYLRNYLSENVGGQVPDLIRLYAYELEGYDAVAFVDFDTLIIRPVDEVVNLIVDGRRGGRDGDGGGLGGYPEGGDPGREVGIGNEDVDDGNGIDAVFSWEHLPSLDNPEVRSTVINLSFFLIRPSRATFDRLLDLYKNAPFSEERGWGDRVGHGSFPGWMSTQGLLTYYYEEVANAAKVEMNRCSFGNTAEEYNSGNSVIYTAGIRVDCGQTGDGGYVDGSDLGQCRDCSKSKFEDVSVADLSYCRAPWECGAGVGVGEDNDDDSNESTEVEGATSAVSDFLLSSGLCRKYQSYWFSGRLQMEDVHPQLQQGDGTLCIDGRYQPMMLLSPTVEPEQR
ncbi:hypothetical protein ACHAXA_009242 [Cyclostephanos tholiformis]|uniref:Uncharacterized protein n=1 Tax=Cyclostephanos tholiformis TaxID=382380 RepID=A0ABD3R9Q7_9STRA